MVLDIWWFNTSLSFPSDIAVIRIKKRGETVSRDFWKEGWLTSRSSRQRCRASLVFWGTWVSSPSKSSKAVKYASSKLAQGGWIILLFSFAIRRSRNVTAVAWLRIDPIVSSRVPRSLMRSISEGSARVVKHSMRHEPYEHFISRKKCSAEDVLYTVFGGNTVYSIQYTVYSVQCIQYSVFTKVEYPLITKDHI